MSSSTPRPRWRTLVLALALSLVPALAHAQTGSVRGTVAGRDGEALTGARVSVAGTRLTAVTDQLGAFTIRGVPAGTHQLRVSHIGFRETTSEVAVRSGEESLVAIQLEDKPFELDAMVVSAVAAERARDRGARHHHPHRHRSSWTPPSATPSRARSRR